MAAFTDYKGVTVVESAAKPGGQNLTDNFKTLADSNVDPLRFNGRLTLTSGEPVNETNQVTGLLYLAPYRGEQIALYNTSETPNFWEYHTLAEFSTGTTGMTVNKPHDVFVYDDSGTLKLDFVVWTNDTTRATALAEVDNVFVKSGATARRYVGTVRVPAALSFVDQPKRRYVWNYYNRTIRSLTRNDIGISWTQPSGSWRNANNNSNAQVEVIVGVSYDAPVELLVFGCSTNPDAGQNERAVGIGINSTTVDSAGIHDGVNATTYQPCKASLVDMPVAGLNTYWWLEWNKTTGTTTWFGALLSASAQRLYGINGWIMG